MNTTNAQWNSKHCSVNNGFHYVWIAKEYNYGFVDWRWNLHRISSQISNRSAHNLTTFQTVTLVYLNSNNFCVCVFSFERFVIVYLGFLSSLQCVGFLVLQHQMQFNRQDTSSENGKRNCEHIVRSNLASNDISKCSFCYA